jgi:hypothetical protein
MLPPKGFEPKLTPKEVKHADWTTRGHSDIKHKKKKKKKKKKPCTLIQVAIHIVIAKQ